jgi:hypothetical protein
MSQNSFMFVVAAPCELVLVLCVIAELIILRGGRAPAQLWIYGAITVALHQRFTGIIVMPVMPERTMSVAATSQLQTSSPLRECS